ncbi:MAG TPA: OmpA family protein, partial [Flavobacteriales bacterium]|nr:OmpA family protein [Flavobacteriales bacterium]
GGVVPGYDETPVVAHMKGRFEAEQHLATAGIAKQQIATRDLHLVSDAGVWLRGVVGEKGKSGYVQGATVTVVNLSSFYSEATTTGEGGDIAIRLQGNEEFEVIIEKTGYFGMSIPISTIGVKQGLIDLNSTRTLELEPIVIGKPVAFKHIKWTSGTAALDPQAKVELDLFAERMKVNPGVNVEIGVHNDARGNAEEYVALSQKRAEAVMAYLVSKGVERDRVTARGYGASHLLNHCSAGVQCSESEHAVNRRVEYTILTAQP